MKKGRLTGKDYLKNILLFFIIFLSFLSPWILIGFLGYVGKFPTTELLEKVVVNLPHSLGAWYYMGVGLTIGTILWVYALCRTYKPLITPEKSSVVKLSLLPLFWGSIGNIFFCLSLYLSLELGSLLGWT